MAGAALAFAVVGVLGVRDSARGAIEESILSDQAHRAFAVQGGPDVSRDVLAQIPGLTPVAETTSSIYTPERRVSGFVRAVNAGDLPLGALIEGRRPMEAAEGTVTKAVAESLSVGLGSSVETATAEGTTKSIEVVGITVDPADLGALSAVVLDPQLDPTSATAWLTDTDPYSIPSLQSVLDQRLATYQSVEFLLADSDARLPVGLQDLRHAGAGLTALLLVFLGLSAATMLPLARIDSTSLRAAGMTEREIWRLLVRVSAGAAIVGQLFGIALALTALSATRVRTSELFGQYWVGIGIPWLWIVVLPVVVIAISSSLRRLVTLRAVAARLVEGRRTLTVKPTPPVLIASIAGCLLLAAAAFAKSQEPPGEAIRLAPVAAVMLAAVLPSLLFPLALTGMQPATRLVTIRLASGLKRSLMVVGILVAISSIHVAQISQDTHAYEESSGAPQPPGSMVINDMPDGAAVALLKEYADRGGRDALQLSIPIESKMQLRVTGPTLVDCMRQAGVTNPGAVQDSCFPQSTYSPVNRVALSASDLGDAAVDPGLLDGGAVGLLEFPSGSGEVVSTELLEASPDDRLGGNLPGLVVDPRGQVASKFGLRSSGTSVVAMLDFSNLSEKDRAAIRATAARLAPSSQSVDASGDTTYQTRRSIAGGQAAGAAALAFLLLIIAAVTVSTANRQTLRVLIDIGASRSSRRRLAARIVAYQVSFVAALVPVVVLVAYLSSVGTISNIGYLWSVPLATALLGCFIVLAPLLRVPPRVGE